MWCKDPLELYPQGRLLRVSADAAMLWRFIEPFGIWMLSTDYKFIYLNFTRSSSALDDVGSSPRSRRTNGRTPAKNSASPQAAWRRNSRYAEDTPANRCLSYRVHLD